jgi:hypothetical protein
MLRPAQILGDDLAIVQRSDDAAIVNFATGSRSPVLSGRSMLRPYKGRRRRPPIARQLDASLITILLASARGCRSAEAIECPRKICGNCRRIAPFDVRPLQHEGDFAVAHQRD